ncbi:hypothetical protein K3495_g9198 [Podosphaera aphanis]|nr:hypothetical protein K3495_g9198 [Podosphaera aphanis]
MSKRINSTGMIEQEFDERAAKRRKIPHGNSDGTTGETTETTTRSGLELLELIKKTTDKNGRLVATNFLTLPSKKLFPDYYHVTKTPIALDTVEAKLKRREFPSLTSLESHLNRMILNAKEYNPRGSPIYDDAERMRKAISGFMIKRNPANKRSTGHDASANTTTLGADIGASEGLKGMQRPEDKAIKLSTHPSLSRSSATPGLTEAQYSGKSFEGLSFQQAQEKIVEDMITEKEYEEDDFGAFEPFIKLPSRKEYKDYYNVVTHPVALKDLQKAVKGVRLKTPGTSEFKTWSAFEEEAAYIWKNAFLYNEDNSDIFKLAMDLQEFFNNLLQKAKAAVAEPVGTKIKLRLPPEPAKITLKIGKKLSPVNSPPSQTALHITNSQTNTSTISRQDPPSASPGPITVAQSERAPSLARPAAVPVPVPAQVPVTALAPAMSQSPTTSIATKKEEIIQKSPVMAFNNHSSNVTTNAVMQPPTTALPTAYPVSGYSQSYFHQSQQTNALDSRFRKPGNYAMVTNLSIATHPGLNISSHFRMDLPSSATLAQQSVTINLPATHYYLQIKPSIASAMLKRQYKLFVTAGTTRLHAMPTIPGHPVEPRNPLFEARLHPGVNRIELELVAAPITDSRSNNDIEIEKISLFVNLMRA